MNFNQGARRFAAACCVFCFVFLGAASAAHALPVPSVSLSVPTQTFIGDNFSFTATFDNTSAVDVGYGPFVDLIFPVNGADGAAGTATPDGIDFAGATYLGVPVTATQLTFPDADGPGPGTTGCVAHPYAVDAAGIPLQVCGTAADKLVVLQLPFGSFTNTQPPAVLTVNATGSNLADLGTPLTIRGRAGFQYGADPLDNPAVDPSILGPVLPQDANTDSSLWSQSGATTPTLLTLTKTYIGPESETATGPNFPRRYTITVTIANGQTVTDLDVTDTLPNNLAYLSLISAAPAFTVTASPPVGVPSNAPTNVLDVNFASVTGTATVTFEYFVPENDANGVPVNDPLTGDDALSPDDAKAVGDWTPVDPRDAGGINNAVADPPGPEHTLTDMSIAIQKSVALVVGGPDFNPGDTVEYTLQFQVSDFFAFQNVVVTDFISDGHRFDTTFAPTLSLTQHGVPSSGPINAANFSVIDHFTGGAPPVPPIDGSQEMQFRISNEMVTRTLSAQILGGCVPVGGTGGPAPNCTTFNAGPTTATLVFRAVIQENYSDIFQPIFGGSGDPSVDHGDSMSNAVTVNGDILGTAALVPTGNQEADTSSAGFTIQRGTLTKTIYARNGNTADTGPTFSPGDTITYRLQYTLPTSDTEQLFFEDFLPLPVLLATEVTPPFDTTVSAAAPPAGRAKLGPADTFFALSAITPTITTDAVANSVRFFYGDFDDPGDTFTTVDILFTVTLQPDPFADGLFLTNQAQASEQNTVQVSAQADAIVQIVLGHPTLGITKGAVATDGLSPTFSPVATGLAGVTIPSAGCPRFLGTVTSAGLLATPVDSNLSGVDAGDTVTFALVVENTGSGQHGAYDVQLRDSIPAGFSIPGGGANICVTDGTGAAIAFTNLGTGLFDPAGGIELSDPGPVNPEPGALEPFAAATGQNIAVITYDLVLDGPGDPAPVAPRQSLLNTGELLNFAASEGGPNEVAAGQNVTNNPDIVTVGIRDPALLKSISSVVPGPITPNTTAGDTVTYDLAVTLPEGVTPGLVLTDTLPAGFQFVAGSVSVNAAGFDGTVTGAPVVSAVGQIITIDLGSVSVNKDNPDDPTDNTFTVSLQALVLNAAANNGLPALQPKTNTVSLNYTGNPGAAVTDQVTTNFGEPQLGVTKSMTPANPGAGSVETITVTVQNTGTAPAYDIVLTDVLDGNLFDLATVAAATTPVGFTYSYVNPTVTYTANAGTAIPAAGSATFIFTANVRLDVVVGTTYSNTAGTTGDSQDGVVAQERPTNASGLDTVSLPNPSVNKVNTATSEPSTDPGDAAVTANPPVAIGEVVTYQLTFRMPEGSAHNVVLRDTLPTGLEHITGTATLDRSSLAITAATNPGTINGNTPGTPVPVSLLQYNTGTGACGPAAATTGQLCLELGNVTNTDADPLTAESFVLTLKVVVQNIAANVSGTNRTNVGRIRFTDFAGTPVNVDNSNNASQRRVHIAEPILSVSKTPDSPTHAGGDTVTFTVVVSNTASGANAASAFEWTFADTLPADYQTPTVSLVNVGATGATVGLVCVGGANNGLACSAAADCPGGTCGFTGNTLNGTIDQLDPGESVTIEYQATLDPAVPFGKVINNTVSTDATSLPGTNGTGSATPGAPGSITGERTGSGGVNNLFTSGNATVTADVPSLVKTTLNPQLRYAIGETPQFQITTGIPVGTQTTFIMTDQLPTVAAQGGELSFNSGTLVISTPAGMTSSNGAMIEGNPAFFTYNAVTNTIFFDFGTVNAPNAGNITISYFTTVTNILDNQNGDSLANTVRLDFDDPNGPGTTTIGPVVNDTPVVIGEPNLDMTKTITAGAVGADAGNTVSWQVTIANNGTTTAYQLDWTDVLPDGLNQISNVAVSTAGGNVFLNGTITPVVTAHAHVKTTLNANDTIDLADSALGDAADTIQIDAGASVTITWDSVVMNTVTPGQVLNNATRASYTSLVANTGGQRDNSTNPGAVDDDNNADLNNYEESASQALTIATVVAIDKTVSPTTYTIGETVTYDIRVDLIEGTTPSLVVTDVLPALPGSAGQVTYISHLISLGNMGMSPGNAAYNTRLGAGQTVQFDFGTLLNPANGNAADDFITIQITARIDNVAGNQNGDVLLNGEQAEGSAVYLEYGAGPTRVDFDHDAGTPGIQGLPITIVEPELNVTKSVVPSSQALGDVVTFTVLVQHAGTSTANAFDLVLDDVLPAGLTYVAGSASLPPADVTVVGQNLQFRISSLPLVPGSTSFTYQATVDITTTVGVDLTNGLSMTWMSLAGATGAPDSGRTGADGPGGALNDYADSSAATVTPNTAAFIDATKTVVDLNGGDVLPGDTLEYTVLLDNTNGAVTGVHFTDTTPAKTTYVAASLALGVCSPGATANDTAAPLLVVDIASMPSGDTCTITFQVTVDAGTAVGALISNQGSVDSDRTVPEPTDEDGVDTNGDQPTDVIVGGAPVPAGSLYVEKFVSWTTDTDASGDVTAGDTLTYAFLLENRGNQVLTNVTLTDTIPAGLTYVPASASISGGGSISVVGQALSASVPSVAIGSFELAMFDVTIDAPLIDLDGDPTAETFTNQATGTSDQTAPTLSDGNGDPTDGNQPTSISAVATPGTGAPAIDLEKRWTLAVDVAGDGDVDPGDTVAYTIRFANSGSGSALDVHVTDPLPANTTMVAGSASTSQGIVITESPLEVNVGNVVPSGIVTVRFRVTIDAGVATCSSVSNQSTVTGSNFGAALSDDNGNDADGLNPTLVQINTNSGCGAFTKVITATSEPDSAGTDVLIGEVLTFQLTGTLPSGPTSQVTFTDTLPTGLAYIAGTARLARVFDVGLQSSVNPGGINTALSGTFVNLTDGTDLTIAGQVLTLFLANVINSDNDPNAEDYILEIQVVVQNVTTNQAGTTLTNPATFTFIDSLSQFQSLADSVGGIAVLEPSLTISKAGTPTSFSQDTGGTVQFTLTVNSLNGTFPAIGYDTLIVDPLPSRYSNVKVTSITTSAGIASFNDRSSGRKIKISVPQFPPGEQMIVNYNATLAPPLTVTSVRNTASLTWTSLPGPQGSGGLCVGGPTPGATCTATADCGTGGICDLPTPGAAGAADGERIGTSHTGAVNDYRGASSVDVALSPGPPPPTPIPSPDLSILKSKSSLFIVGSQGSYLLTVTNVGGGWTTGTATVTDPLPSGLTFASASGGAWSCSAAGQLVTCTNTALIAPGTSTVIALAVNVTSAAFPTVTNSATVSTPGDPNPTNDTDFEPTTILLGAPTGTPSATAPAGTPPPTATPTPSANPSLPASISGQVRNDMNGDGNLADADPGIGVVKVELFTDPNGDGDPSDGILVAVTTTDNAGFYSFAALTAGDYVVVETDPAGFNSTADVSGTNDNRIPVALSAGTTSGGNDFLDTEPAAISGQVREDTDADANFADPDSGLRGVTVQLFTDPNSDGDPADGTLVATTTTSSPGDYTFSGLSPGDYVVVETDPSGFASTADTGGANDNLIPVSLPSGTNRPGNDFLDTQGVANGIAAISGQVRNDLNGDANLADPDPALSTVTVQLFSDPNGDGDPADGTLLGTTATDAAGGYSFLGLAAGDYVVVETDPAGFTSTADVSAPNDNRIPVVLLTGSLSAGNDFLDTRGSNGGGGTAMISGQVREDQDGDGDLADTDPGIGVVKIQLFTDPNGDGNPSDGVLVAVTTTDSGGFYVFDALAAASYVVVESDPGGFTSTADLVGTNDNFVPVALTTGAASTGNDFLDTRPADISGQVRNDVDADGNLADPDAGLRGVTVQLFSDPNGDGDPADGTLVASMATTGAGAYAFTGLPAANYVIVESDPSGMTSTADTGGANDNRIALVLSSGTSRSGNDFLDTGVTASGGGTASITGQVRHDLNANGNFADSDPALSSVTVRLFSDPNGDGDPADGVLLVSTLTDSGGMYVFGNLSADTFVVVETDPAGFTSTADVSGANDNRIPVALATGATSSANDFLDTRRTAAGGTAAITGQVRDDLDGDGSLADTDPGIAVVKIQLFTDPNGDGNPADGSIVAVTTTGRSGFYSFTGLDAGAYVVTENDPGGYTSTADVSAANDNRIAVLLATGTTAGGNDFLDTRRADISGQVRNDTDADGNFADPDLGLGGVSIRLFTDPNGDGDPSDGVAAGTALTNGPGDYRFTGLLPGAYVVIESDPTGFSSSADTGGANDNRIPLSLTSGVSRNGNDFLDTQGSAGGTSSTCMPNLRKVHAGLGQPGGTITYTLLWTNPCRDTFANVVVEDPLPAGLSFVAANSSDAVVTNQGGTVTLSIASLPKGPGGTATITARIETTVANGTSVLNQATLTDNLGRTTTAQDFLRVRTTGSRGELNCAIRAQVFSRPGTFVRYVARFKYGTRNNTLTLSLPPRYVDVLRIFPTPTVVDGSTIVWNNLARTSGLVKVNTQIGVLAPDGVLLQSSAVVADGLGNTTRCDHTSVVRRSNRLSLALRGNSKSRPGRTIAYTARYRDAVGSTVVTVTLPGGVTVQRILPAPTRVEGRLLTWEGLPAPAGLVKVRATVDATVASGSVLTASATVIDATATVLEATHDTSINVTSRNGTSQSDTINLSGQRNTRPGSTVTFLARYRNVTAGSSLAITLPAGLSLITALPPPGLSNGGTLQWPGLAGSTGTVRVNTLVSTALANGTTLTTTAELTDSTGIVAARDTATTMVNSLSGTSSSGPTLSIAAAKSVRRGLTTNITVSYRNLSTSGTLELTLPRELSAQLSVPAASIGAGGQVRWSGVAVPGGSLKVRVLVDPAAVPGSALTLEATLTDGGTGIPVTTTQTLAIRTEVAPAAPTLTLNLPNTVTPGLTASLSLRYANVQGPATLRLTLPPQMTPQMSVPAGATVNGDLVWSGFAGGRGSLKARILVDPALFTGTDLSVHAVLDDANQRVSASATTTGR